MIYQIENITWNWNIAKSLKRTKKHSNPTLRKSPVADASIVDETRYPDESMSEENCFGALNENRDIA